MSDADEGSAAWRTTPTRYLQSRPPAFAVGAPASRYLPMDDGCRLALDVYLPGGAAGPFPTILILTPYYRRFALSEDAPAGTEQTPNIARWRDLFVARGYAVVAVDVRGTGASFGTRNSFRSPRERADYRIIADWIVAQPWSDGSIGATGISYVGAACDFLASTGHPAVRAIAPLFAVWDTYADHYYPGGLLLNRLAENYDALMLALDHDRRDVLQQFAYFKDPHFRGPQPVDGDPGDRHAMPPCARIAAISACPISSRNSASARRRCPTTPASAPPASAPTTMPRPSRPISPCSAYRDGWMARATPTARSPVS